MLLRRRRCCRSGGLVQPDLGVGGLGDRDHGLGRRRFRRRCVRLGLCGLRLGGRGWLRWRGRRGWRRVGWRRRLAEVGRHVEVRQIVDSRLCRLLGLGGGRGGRRRFVRRRRGRRGLVQSEADFEVLEVVERRHLGRGRCCGRLGLGRRLVGHDLRGGLLRRRRLFLAPDPAQEGQHVTDVDRSLPRLQPALQLARRLEQRVEAEDEIAAQQALPAVARGGGRQGLLESGEDALLHLAGEGGVTGIAHWRGVLGSRGRKNP